MDDRDFMIVFTDQAVHYLQWCKAHPDQACLDRGDCCFYPIDHQCVRCCRGDECPLNVEGA